MKTTLSILGLYMLSNPIILPGTNYCGPGGQQNKDDHPLYDHCPEQIPRFTWKFELYNFCPYTLSLCDCDMKFLGCLKDDGSWMSTKVGQLYFNVLQMPCFELTDGRICQQRTFWGRCIEEIEGQIAELKEPPEFWRPIRNPEKTVSNACPTLKDNLKILISYVLLLMHWCCQIKISSRFFKKGFSLTFEMKDFFLLPLMLNLILQVFQKVKDAWKVENQNIVLKLFFSIPPLRNDAFVSQYIFSGINKVHLNTDWDSI